MSTTEPELAEPKPGRRWFQMSHRTLLVLVSLLLVVVLLPVLWSGPAYDKERYSQIRRTIDSDQGHLLGKSLEEIARELNLEGIPYDEVDEPQGLFDEKTRIYHFRGFACYVTMGTFPPDVTPDGMHLASSSQPASPRQGKLPLTVRSPGVASDGFSNPKERMEQHWKREREAIEQMQRAASREHKKANNP